METTRICRRRAIWSRGRVWSSPVMTSTDIHGNLFTSASRDNHGHAADVATDDGDVHDDDDDSGASGPIKAETFLAVADNSNASGFQRASA